MPPQNAPQEEARPPLAPDWLLQPLAGRQAASADLDPTDSRFTAMLDLVTRGEYITAAHRAEQALHDGLMDIRVLGYYLFGCFVEKGPGGLPQLYRILNQTLGPNAEAIGPRDKREVHVENALHWLFSAMLRNVEHHARSKDDVWKAWVDDANRPAIDAALDLSTELQALIAQHSPKSKATQRFQSVDAWMRDLERPAPPPPAPAAKATPEKTAPEKTADDRSGKEDRSGKKEAEPRKRSRRELAEDAKRYSLSFDLGDGNISVSKAAPAGSSEDEDEDEDEDEELNDRSRDRSEDESHDNEHDDEPDNDHDDDDEHDGDLDDDDNEDRDIDDRRDGEEDDDEDEPRRGKRPRSASEDEGDDEQQVGADDDSDDSDDDNDDNDNDVRSALIARRPGQAKPDVGRRPDLNQRTPGRMDRERARGGNSRAAHAEARTQVGGLDGEVVEGSAEWQTLLQRLRGFESLLQNGDYMRAAVLAQDIQNAIATFDPVRYFPTLFSGYLAAFSEHMQPLETCLRESNSVQFKVLQKLFQVSPEQFLRRR